MASEVELQIVFVLDTSFSNGQFFKKILDPYIVPILKLCKSNSKFTTFAAVFGKDYYPFMNDVNSFYKLLQKINFTEGKRRFPIAESILNAVDMFDDRYELVRDKFIAKRHVFVISSSLPLYPVQTEIGGGLEQKDVRLSLIASRPMKELMDFYEKVRLKSVSLSEVVDNNMYIFKICEFSIASLFSEGNVQKHKAPVVSSINNGDGAVKAVAGFKIIWQGLLVLPFRNLEFRCDVSIIIPESKNESDYKVPLWPVGRMNLKPTKIDKQELSRIIRNGNCLAVQVRAQNGYEDKLNNLVSLLDKSGNVILCVFNAPLNNGIIFFGSKGVLLGAAYVNSALPFT